MLRVVVRPNTLVFALLFFVDAAKSVVSHRFDSNDREGGRRAPVCTVTWSACTWVKRAAFVVVDAVAVLTEQLELENEVGGEHMGPGTAHARRHSASHLRELHVIKGSPLDARK